MIDIQQYWYWVVVGVIVVILLWEILQYIFKRTFRRTYEFIKWVLKPLGVFKKAKVIMLVELILIIGLGIMVIIYVV